MTTIKDLRELVLIKFVNVNQASRYELSNVS